MSWPARGGARKSTGESCYRRCPP